MAWFLRGIVFGAWTALLTVFDMLSSYDVHFNNQSDLITITFFACVLAGIGWGFADGYADPHRQQHHLVAQWGLSTIVAGVFGGGLAWLIYTYNLHTQMSGPIVQILWALFTLAIVLFIPSTLALAAGRAIAIRKLRRAGDGTDHVTQGQQIPLHAKSDDHSGGQRT
ncbi:hypothetical protein BI330_18660 [Mycobacterium sp. CBMA 623]|nr:hypothetical protein [Mycobacteroides sp. CBMA 326]